MDRLQMYYKRNMYGGRSLVARILDFVLLRALLLFVIFFVMLYLSRSLTMSILISIFVTAAISLTLVVFKRKKARKFMQQDLLRIQRKCLLETLTFMNLDEFAKFITKMFKNNLSDIALVQGGLFAQFNSYSMFVFHNHPSSKNGVSDILRVYRRLKTSEKILIVTLSVLNEDAKKLCASLPTQIKVITGKSVLKIAQKMNMLPDEESAREKAMAEMNEQIVTLKKIKKNALGPVKIKGYIICGIAIMLWPLVTGFKFYYPIIAAVCFALAIITYKKNKQVGQTSDIGIS